MKILIIESGGHEQIIHKFLTIIPKKEEIIILGKAGRKDWFSKDVLRSYQVEMASRWTFWRKASSLSKDVSKVIIYGTPEYAKGIYGLVELFFYVWFIRKHQKKTNVLIRNTRKWHKTNLVSKIRNFSLRYLKDRMIFEYGEIQKSLPISSKYCLLPVSTWQDNPFSWDSKIVIGFAGSISATRRDYSCLFEALGQLSAEEKGLINLKICCAFNDIEHLQPLMNEVNFAQTINNQADYDVNIKSTHLLIAPLTTHINYGITKGTGAFGDALYANRKVVIPRFACFDSEFDGVALYYENPTDLHRLFKTAIDAWKRRDESFFVISHSARNRFSQENAYHNYLQFIFSK